MVDWKIPFSHFIGRSFHCIRYTGYRYIDFVSCRYDDLKTGTCIGADKYGNRYYQNTRYFVGQWWALHFLCEAIRIVLLGRSRWVEYADRVGLDYDASQIPPEWWESFWLRAESHRRCFRHRWLQYISDEPPTVKPLPKHSWMIDHIENKTGTSQIYVPYSTVPPKIQSWQPPAPSSTMQNSTSTKSPAQ